MQEKRIKWKELKLTIEHGTLVLLDENGVNIGMTRRYGRAIGKCCFEDDISEVRLNAETLAEEKWSKRASSYIQKMSFAYSEIMGWDFNSVEKSYSSKAVFLRAYDAYFSWTSDFFEENREIWHDVNLWDEASHI